MTQADPNTSNIEPKPSYGIEELQVVGEQLVGKVKELVREGNVRRIIIKQEGHTTLTLVVRCRTRSNVSSFVGDRW